MMLLGVGRGTLACRLAEDKHLGEAVCAEAVRAVDGDAAALARCKDAGDARRARLVVGHLKSAHGVVAGRADENRFFRNINACKTLCEVVYLPEAFVDALGWDFCKVEVDTGGQTLADAASLLDLRGNGTCDDVARRELHLLGGVFRHEAFAVLVEELCTLGAAGLGEQHAIDGEPRRMELHHLGILERDADVHACDDAVACRAVRVGGTHPVGASVAARGNDDGLRGDADEVARTHVHCDDARELAGIRHADLEHLALGDEVNIVCEALLEECVHHGVSRTILEVCRTRIG